LPPDDPDDFSFNGLSFVIWLSYDVCNFSNVPTLFVTPLIEAKRVKPDHTTDNLVANIARQATIQELAQCVTNCFVTR
jgi:hypothetical protein